VTVDELDSYQLPAANYEIVRALKTKNCNCST